MPLNRSEHQDRYLWFTPEDCKSCRSYPVKKPESLRLSGGLDMEPEYRSSYIMYPMVDKTTKILPREMFRLDSPVKVDNRKTKFSVEPEIIQKLNEEDKRTQMREKTKELQPEKATTVKSQLNTSPSEYQQQFVPQLIEKAHSIPQIDHIKIQGDFQTIPEYQDSFKMYSNYVKTMPIIKNDNLRVSGSEIQLSSEKDSKNIPEYREKFHDLPKNITKEKPLKAEDHLRPNGEFSKDVPEYYESFRDPQVKQAPEKGKCPEPYLHLKGKLEFNPEYRNTYLNFPRSRPIVPKPTTTFRLPISSVPSNTNSNRNRPSISLDKHVETSNATPVIVEPKTDITITPEYRRACYNYQIRERSPKQKAIVAAPTAREKKKVFRRKSVSPQYQMSTTTLRRQRGPLLSESPQSSSPGPEYKQLKTPKFGRRAVGSVLKNAANCRTNTTSLESNPKYTVSQRKDLNNSGNIHDSFIVLENRNVKRSHLMN